MIHLLDRLAVLAIYGIAVLGWVLFWYGLAAFVYFVLTLK